MSKTLIVTGSSGMLGQVVAQELRNDYQIIGLDTRPSYGSFEFRNIDLTDAPLVEKEIKKIGPDFIIHCAALTDVSLCEQNPKLARMINQGATENVARSCPANAKFIYLSTASVFDGKNGNYSEQDIPHPISQYAKSKLEAEAIVSQLIENHVIIRTDIIGWKIGQFMIQKLVDDALSKNKTVDGYDDAYFSPISVNSMAKILGMLLVNDYKGILHIGCSQPVSKYEFCFQVASSFGFDVNLVRRVAQRDQTRPKNTSLNVGCAENLLGKFNSAKNEIEILKKHRGEVDNV